MKTALLSLIILFILVFVVFFTMGLYSETGSPPGLGNGQLAPCPATPNCVSSQSAPFDKHAVEAFVITPTMGDEPLLKVRDTIEQLGGDISFANDNYLASTFTSDLFRFVDDVEFQVDTASGLLHVRSASRVGYIDLNSNRKRVEKIRGLLQEK